MWTSMLKVYRTCKATVEDNQKNLKNSPKIVQFLPLTSFWQTSRKNRTERRTQIFENVKQRLYRVNKISIRIFANDKHVWFIRIFSIQRMCLNTQLRMLFLEINDQISFIYDRDDYWNIRYSTKRKEFLNPQVIQATACLWHAIVAENVSWKMFYRDV